MSVGERYSPLNTWGRLRSVSYADDTAQRSWKRPSRASAQGNMRMPSPKLGIVEQLASDARPRQMTAPVAMGSFSRMRPLRQ